MREEFPAIRFESVGDILTYLESAANELERLDAGVAKSRAKIALASGVLELLKVGEFEQRLEAIERALGGR